MTSAFQSIPRRRFLGLALVSAAPTVARSRFPDMAGVRFRELRHGRSRWRFLHIHGDETTARDTMEETAKRAKGRSFFVESSTRFVKIPGGEIDPNRMFSREGAEKSFKSRNRWTPESLAEAMAALDRDRERFLKAILPPRRGLLVALHNNSQGYSIRAEESASQRVSLKRPNEPFEFMLLTSPADFAVVERSPFNCVLQDRPGGEEDGSLSRLCAARRIRYINIEAKLGNREAQQAMLDWILRELR
jgi:hypothetical protein